MNYNDFLDAKLVEYKPSGFEIDVSDINNILFDWQKELVRLSLFRGRSALFEDCGLGKTFQQIEWARHVSTETGLPVLILAPLAVSIQTVREGVKLDVNINICKSSQDVTTGINITNYERLDKFDPSVFGGIVLDESGILKNFAGKIRNQIIDSFRNTPYKLCCTATPSPNDYTELGNTAEFLGVMTRPEMLAMFFINDTGSTTSSWRMKGHVSDNKFWEWLSSWSVMIRKPSDLGFCDDGFDLPHLNIKENIVPFTGQSWTLFVEPATTLSDRRGARKDSMDERVNLAANIVNRDDKTWLVWCNLNTESELLKTLIKGSVEVKGSDSQIHKETSMLSFADGDIKCLVSKPSIAGLGMNFQSCSNMIFVGLSDSFEQFYQAVRRCWRFGQKNNVTVHIVTGEREGAVVENIKRKERAMQSMFDGMVVHMKGLTMKKMGHTEKKSTPYIPTVDMIKPQFLEVSL